MRFADLPLAPFLHRALADEGYETATPIQAQAIPPALAGRDVLGIAQTGTGKTAAFAVPLLHRMAERKPVAGKRRVRVLVLVPTRELAAQVEQSFRAYGRGVPDLRTLVVFGGVGQNPQASALHRGVDVLVATPGRLLDLVDQRLCDLGGVEALVLDEADRMFDMGFVHAVRRVVSLIPSGEKRQTLLFSATMPSEVRQLANTVLRDPAYVEVTPVSSTVERVRQSLYFVDKGDKPKLLATLFRSLKMTRAIVFTRTKHGADKVTKKLEQAGIRAEALHGNKGQNARQRALANFASGRTPVLVATDIASRGIDVDAISHVVNYDLTHEPESYVHRIGRTARAGADGEAVSFCDREEVPNLRQIERLTNVTLERRELPEGFHAAGFDPNAALASEPLPAQTHVARREPHRQHAPRPEPRVATGGGVRPKAQHGHPFAPAARPGQHAPRQRGAQPSAERAGRPAPAKSAFSHPKPGKPGAGAGRTLGNRGRGGPRR